jgi:hypothetical protein
MSTVSRSRRLLKMGKLTWAFVLFLDSLIYQIATTTPPAKTHVATVKMASHAKLACILIVSINNKQINTAIQITAKIVNMGFLCTKTITLFTIPLPRP